MTIKLGIKPIKTEKDYDRALKLVEDLMDAEADTPAGDALEVLVTLIEAYEAKRWPIDLPDPIDAIRVRMEQYHLRPRDLEPYLGSSGRVSEVLNRRRPLTLAMIRKLNQSLRIPARVLVQEPAGKRVPRRRHASK
jgi:HTH-type transcriptional regulator / antitoxin HigA